MNFLVVLCLSTIGGRIHAQDYPIGENLKDFATALSGRFYQAHETMLVTIKPVSLPILPRQQSLAFTLEYTSSGIMQHGQILVFHNMATKIEIEVYSINPDWLSNKLDINELAPWLERADITGENCTTEYELFEGAYRMGVSTCDSQNAMSKVISLDCKHLFYGINDNQYELDKSDHYWVPDRFTPTTNKCKS